MADSDNDSHALLWQGFFAIAMFVSTFACYLLPIFIFTYRNGQLQSPNLTEQYMHLPAESLDVHDSHEVHEQILKKKRRKLKRLLSYCNCVSGGVFLGVCFLNLIPCVEEEFAKLIKDYEVLRVWFGSFPIGLFSVICGLFLVLILETLLSASMEKSTTASASSSSNGASSSGPHNNGSSVNVYVDDDSSQHHEHEQMLNERASPLDSHHHHHHEHPPHHQSHSHGHSHMTVDMFKDKSDSMLSFFILMFATSIHSLFEGLALGLQSDVSNAIRLFIGIIIHECLVAIALGLNAVRLQQDNIRLVMHLKFAFLFSLTIPVGNIMGILLGYTPGHTGRFISAIFQGLAAGTFIHVTFLELIPEELILSNDCDTEEDIDNDRITESISTTPINGEELDKIEQNGEHHHHQRPDADLHSHGHSHSPAAAASTPKSVKMNKILLLLLGFLIMTIIPFITND